MSQRIAITGGSSGLGLALAHALTARGDAVALLARDERKLEQAARDIGAAVPNAKVFVTTADVQDAKGLELALSGVAGPLGGIDTLVNCAGIMKEGYFESLPLAAHREVMNINYFGTLNAIKTALPYLKSSTRGRIVTVASVAGLTGVFGYTAYCAAKHALVGLSESLRYELAPQGIIVQLVCPAEFDSPLVDALDRTRTPENREHTLTIPKVGVDVIVRAMIRGMDGDEFMIVPGRLARLSVLGLRHFPGLSRAISAAKIRKVYVGP